VAITVRDSVPRKRNIASLVGGVVIAAGCFVLWVLVSSQLTQQWPPSLPLLASGLVVALAIGFWIRLADL
jgi:lipopolysaccharide export LptBFGC system permease protein LptF